MTSKTKVDIKKSAEGMSLQDKAKLLFAYRNRYIETSGLERIFTPDELNAIYKDARKNYQMDELKRLNKLYKLANLLLGDLEIACLSFEAEYQRFLGVLIAIYLNENTLNLLWELIDDVAKTKKQKKALEKKWILEKHQKKYRKFVKDFLQQTAKINEETNLPYIFTDTIERLKSYKKLKYQLDYIIDEKAKINFLSITQKKRLKEYDDHIEHFSKMKEFYSKVLHIDLEETIKRVGKSKFSQFLKMIENIAIELTEQDKKKARKEIDEILNRYT